MAHPELIGAQADRAAATRLAVGGVVAVGVWSMRPLLVAVDLRTFSVACLGVAVVLGVIVWRASPTRYLSAAFLVYLLLAVFHLGLLVRPAMTGHRGGQFTYALDRDWYQSAALQESGWLALLGLSGFALGVCAVTLPRVRSSSMPISHDNDVLTRGFASAGALVTLIGMAGWLAFGINKVGFGFMSLGYLDFLSETASLPLPVAYMLVGLGVPLLALRLDRPAPLAVLLLFLGFGAVAFLMGLRNEIAIPVLGAIVAWAASPTSSRLRAWLLSPRGVVAAGIALLVALNGISLVQQVRLAGLAALNPSQVAARPIDAVEEMGFTLRVVTVSRQWHDDNQEPFLDGATYWATLDRSLTPALGLFRLPATSDPRLMNVEIDRRVGAIGGSMIAEAHHNFAAPGTFVVLALFGAAAGAVSRPRGAWTAALAGPLSVLELMHVRNSFAPIPMWAGAAALILAVGVALGALHRRREGMR